MRAPALVSSVTHCPHPRNPAALAAAAVLLSSGWAWAAAARADDEPPVAPAAAAPASAASGAAGQLSTVIVASQKTRSSVALSTSEIQSVLPGVNPVKALQTLPGVTFETADPWGNNEQNLSLYVHGFNAQQLGYTLDGVPLGDQQYGNYNGLSPQRAVISENVGSVVLSSGAGDLATASTSNLGGTIETFSADPSARRGATLAQTVGSYRASRSYARIDTGSFGDGNAAYVSVVRQRAKAWDFDAHQGGVQINGKFVHESDAGKLTLYVDHSDKTEPNEDSIVHVAGETSAPYTRPFLYPDYTAALAYLSPTGATPAADGSNYRNYYSDAQRTDDLAYAKYEARLSEAVTWTNQVYGHRDSGEGVVAGPIGVAGLPALFSVYFPGQDLKQVFGNSGYAVRTTEYRIHRYGWLTSADWQLADHRIDVGGWIENNRSQAYRRWYPFDVNHPKTPYDQPSNPAFTQYGSQIENHVAQLHLQDEWRVRPWLALQAGFKSSLQFADGTFPVQELAAAIGHGSTGLPQGEIVTKRWFLPQFGALWDLTPTTQAFANVQKNLRQFVTYGAGGLSPWSLASQSSFDLFKATAQPETSLTYEAGVRGALPLALGPVDKLDGQISVYHVNFRNRLLQISPTPVISSIVGGNPILANVGSVRTDGIDVAATLHLGRMFSFYDALSYNRSIYEDDYSTGSAVVATSGKAVPGSPNWLDKFVATFAYQGFEAQLMGDYVGKRYVTYTNDLSVPSYFTLNLALTQTLPLSGNDFLKSVKVQVNVTNLNNERGASTVAIGAASGTYNTYPIPPRQYFITFTGGF